MLELKGIVKDYGSGETVVRALKGVSLSFRKSEFVSILGASGCGKTTMLNILGGLDRYTSGDLLINGRSTKEFKDRDWDVYRNHKVGFIFQSYNLIPHQTVLGNVELALTIAGMNKEERVIKAKAALDRVGLSDQYYKRPNQLSGGQCQRVAIARALVNDPEILLADEPTGALDSVTSVQIMELVQEIAKDRLVVMVTHNPEIAEKYSTRIIHLSDGCLVSDSSPYAPSDEERTEAMRQEEEQNRPEMNPKTGKEIKKKAAAKMSFWTAFKLSLHNLLTKKRRTLMISIAGSIGIIGVSLVLAVSYGVQGFINNMQNDMLSGNPITVSESALDLSALMSSGEVDTTDLEWENGKINVDSTIANLVKRSENMSNLMQSNEITQDYIDYVKMLPESQVSALMLGYGLNLSNNLYTDFTPAASKPSATNPGNGNTKNMSLAAIKALYESILLETKDYAQYASFISSLDEPFSQLPVEEDYIVGNPDKKIEGQYNLVSGEGFTSRYAKTENEVMLVLRKDADGGYHYLSDLLLAQLGFYSQNQFMNLVFKAISADPGSPFQFEPALDIKDFSYADILNHEFTYYPNSVAFEEVNALTEYTQVSSGSRATTVADESKFHHRADAAEFSQTEKSAGIPLKVVGILEPKDDLSYGTLSAGFFYTQAFRDKVILTEEPNEAEGKEFSPIVQYLVENGSISSQFQKEQRPLGQSNLVDSLQGVTFQYDYVYPYEGDSGVRTTYAAIGAGNPFLQLATTLGGAAQGATAGFSASGLEQIMSGLSAKNLTLRALTGRQVQRASLDTAAVLTQAGTFDKDKAVLLAGINTAEDALTLAQKALSDAQNGILEAMMTGSVTTTHTDAFNAAVIQVALKTVAALTEWQKISDCFASMEFTGNQHIVTAQISVDGVSETVKLTFDRKGALINTECGALGDKNVYIGVAAMYLEAAASSSVYGDGVKGAEYNIPPVPVILPGGLQISFHFVPLTLTPMISCNAIANNISIYPVDFDQKQLVLAHLNAWNGDGAVTIAYADGSNKTLTAEERADITYSDILSLIFAMVGMFINIITTALICFTALSLVVSTVMIAIITYVSVVERIKEIGVIRSLGGRKKDVARLFNAETIIIGLVAGIIGIAFTWFASWIINLIVGAFVAGVGAIAVFPWFYALLMVGVSVGLTLISGLIPSRSAAKKDPVVALRSE